MKKLILGLCMLSVVLLCVAQSTVVTPGVPTMVRFSWSYPANELTPDLAFRIYVADSVTATNWVMLANCGTNLTATTTILPGAKFFYLTVSNFWGETGPSRVESTPPLPRTNVTLQIGR